MFTGRGDGMDLDSIGADVLQCDRLRVNMKPQFPPGCNRSNPVRPVSTTGPFKRTLTSGNSSLPSCRALPPRTFGGVKTSLQPFTVSLDVSRLCARVLLCHEHDWPCLHFGLDTVYCRFCNAPAAVFSRFWES